MKTFLLSLILLVGFTAQATYIPQGETITIGNVVLFPKNAGFKRLICHPGGSTNECNAREPGAASGYQVPVGKTFKIRAIELQVHVAGLFYLAYSSNDVGMYASGGSQTSVVYPGGDIGGGKIITAATGSSYIPAYFDVPAGNYPALNGNGGGGGPDATAYLYGYEE